MKWTIFAFLFISLIILLNLSTIQTFNAVTAQQNIISGKEVNVTRDMVNLLSNLTDSFIEREAMTYNNITSDRDEPVQQNPSTLNNSYANPESIVLGDIVLPENSSMLVYQTEPLFISEGHLSANLPCNEEYFSTINMLVGKIPNLSSIPLEPVRELSNAGELCIYQVTLLSNATNSISQIAIQNNSTRIELPSASSIIIGVSKLASNSALS